MTKRTAAKRTEPTWQGAFVPNPMMTEAVASVALDRDSDIHTCGPSCQRLRCVDRRVAALMTSPVPWSLSTSTPSILVSTDGPIAMFQNANDAAAVVDLVNAAWRRTGIVDEVPRKRRGRPPGSKNKPKVVAKKLRTRRSGKS